MTLAEHTHLALARLVPPGARVLVAVSGGPDSQALLDLVGRLRGDLGLARVWAVGVDHGLRAAARNELSLAAALAASHGIDFATLRVRVSKRGNLLAAARRARYAALRRFAREVGAAHIALAHTATDQVETILMHLVRGAALAGAGGMRSRRGMLVRPLIGVTRAQIEAYLAERGVAFANDPSNVDARRQRAHLRAHVLPALRALNPELEASFARFAAHVQADQALLGAIAHRALARRRGPGASLNVADVSGMPEPIATRVVRAWLLSARVRCDRKGVVAVLALARAGRGTLSAGGRLIRAQVGHLFVENARPFALPLHVPGQVTLAALDVMIHSRVSDGGAALDLGDGRLTVAFDADHLHSELEVRSWRMGDRFRPFGLDGQMKVGDLFTNLKVPQALRAAWPLVSCGNEIAWVVGLRRAELAPVTHSTRRIVSLDVYGALMRKAW